MEEVIKITSMPDDEDKKELSEIAGILVKQNKYSRLRKEIEIRWAEVKKGEVLSHEEIWQDISRSHASRGNASPDVLRPVSAQK